MGAQWTEEQVRAMDGSNTLRMNRFGDSMIDMLKEAQIEFNKANSAWVDASKERLEEWKEFFGYTPPTRFEQFCDEWKYRFCEAWAALRGRR